MYMQYLDFYEIVYVMGVMDFYCISVDCKYMIGFLLCYCLLLVQDFGFYVKDF